MILYTAKLAPRLHCTAAVAAAVVLSPSPSVFQSAVPGVCACAAGDDFEEHQPEG